MKRKLKEKKENFLKKTKLTESIYGSLPNELLHQIFAYLVPQQKKQMKTFVELNLVSKNWYEYFNNENDVYTKDFWLNFYIKYFDLENNHFHEVIDNLTITDLKEIFFERFELERGHFKYYDVNLTPDKVKNALPKKYSKYFDYEKFNTLEELFISPNSLIVTSVAYHEESVWLERSEYEYGMRPSEMCVDVKATVFLRNSYSMDLDISYTGFSYYEDEDVDRVTFSLKVNDKALLVWNEEYLDVSTMAIEKLCESVEVKLCRSFFIYLLFFVLEIIKNNECGGVTEMQRQKKLITILNEIRELEDEEDEEDEEI
eukprot:gene5625-9442_t